MPFGALSDLSMCRIAPLACHGRPTTSVNLGDLNRVLRQQRSSPDNEPRSGGSSSPSIWDLDGEESFRKEDVGDMNNDRDRSAAASPFNLIVADDDDDLGFAPAQNHHGDSPLIRSNSSAAILGVRSGGRSGLSTDEKIMTTLLKQMSVDDNKPTLQRRASWGDDLGNQRFDLSTPQMNNRSPINGLQDMPRQTIEERPKSASGKSRVASASIMRLENRPFQAGRKRNKSAGLLRRRENAVRRAVEADKEEQFYVGEGKTVEDIERPPSRQSNAFPMSLADPYGKGRSTTGEVGGGEGEGGTSEGGASDGGGSGSGSGGEGRVNASASSSLGSNGSSSVSMKGKKKVNRPSSRKKPPAKNMFLNDDTKLDGTRQLVTEVKKTSPPRNTGWGEPGAGEGEAGIGAEGGSGGEDKEVAATVGGSDKLGANKVKVIRSSGSPSNLSLGDPNDEIEFVLSPVPPTRVREIDERRDNPERDGFAEIEESGLYEIKIEVQNERGGGGGKSCGEKIPIR